MPLSPPLPQQQSILLVDQQRNTAGLMQVYLRANGYTVDHTDDPSEALRFASKARYGMVITDLVMQEMSGIDLYREIKPLDEDIHFLFLLRMSSTPAAALRLMGSVDREDVIKKEPLSINELIFKVRAAFSSSSLFHVA